MDPDISTLIICLCLIFEAFFSGSEIAFISVNRFKLKHKAQSGSTGAQEAERLLEHPEKIFAATSVGTNIAVVTGTAVCTSLLAGIYGERGDFYATLIMAPIILLFGEIIPKSIFHAAADALSPKIARPLKWGMSLLFPVVAALVWIVNFLLKAVSGGDFKKTGLVTRDDLLHWLKEGGRNSELEEEERKMIQNVFRLSEIPVEKCMVPLFHAVALEENSTVRQTLKFLEESQYTFSRIPVFQNRIFNITGILNTFDLLGCKKSDQSIKTLLRPAYFIPKTKLIDDLLRELQHMNTHMTIVLDEYGGAIGIVTIEDLLEEIVGEITDEYDEEEKLYERLSDYRYRIDASMEIGAIREQLGLDLPAGDYETLGGLILDRLRRIPKAGENVVSKDLTFRIKKATAKKIVAVEVLLKPGKKKKAVTRGVSRKA